VKKGETKDVENDVRERAWSFRVCLGVVVVCLRENEMREQNMKVDFFGKKLETCEGKYFDPTGFEP
jgi:hypothetical protein